MGLCKFSLSYIVVLDMSPVPLCSDLSQDGKLRICQERFQASSDSDTATAETIREMCRRVHESAADPYCLAYAKDAVWRFGGGVSGGLKFGDFVLPFNARDPRVCSWGDFWWTKHHLQFVHHEKLLYDWLKERDQLQLLTRPAEICRGILPAKGDCAIYTMLIATFLSIQNIPWELVTVKCDPRRPTEYAHIFPRVVLPSGMRVALDASHGKYPGWEVPQEHRFATQVWDPSGDPIPDMQFGGLHGYIYSDEGAPMMTRPATFAPMMERRGINLMRRGLRGLGQGTDFSGETPIDSTPNLPSSTPVVTDPTATPGFNWSGEIANLLNQGVSLAGKVVAPTTTMIRNKDGSYSIVTPASASAGQNLLATSAVAGIGTNWLLIGGLAAIAILLIGKR